LGRIRAAMRLLVSVRDVDEALEAIRGGAHIVDVKNPEEGSLGAHFPRVIRQVKEAVSGAVEVSATIGDLPNLPGTASLAALGAAVSGARYVKAGLFGVRTIGEAEAMMREICRAVKEYNSDVKVIAAGYADFESYGCLNPLSLPLVAHKSGADGVMIDVKGKNPPRKLFDYLGDEELRKFVCDAHSLNQIVALAGSLGLGDIRRVHRLGADIIGVRRGVCIGGDRLRGRVESSAVAKFVEEIKIQAMQ